MGGGRRGFYPANHPDPETGRTDVNKRQDGNNLVQDWVDTQRTRGRRQAFVWKKDDFENLDVNSVDYLLGTVFCIFALTCPTKRDRRSLIG